MHGLIKRGQEVVERGSTDHDSWPWDCVTGLVHYLLVRESSAESSEEANIDLLRMWV